MQTLYDTFSAVAIALPYNVWPWLFYLAPPILIFSVKPEAALWKRVGRLVLTILIGYAALSLSAERYYTNGWQMYQECQSQFEDGAIQRHYECGNPPGSSPIFTILLAWIPAAGWVGFWDYLWFRRYKKEIESIKLYRGWSLSWLFSDALHWLAIPTVMFTVLFWLAFIYNRIDCSQLIIESGACWFSP